MIDALRRRRAPSSPDPISGSDDGVVRISLPSLLALHHGAESLPLRPQHVRTHSSGGYLSPFKGRGMEFDEVRPYMQGDDVRSIDWRVTARSGRPHTKLFREERERPVLLFIDLRAAMFFATRGAFKAVRAAQAAALLGWSTLHRGDRLGALLFDEQTHVELRPKRGQPPFVHLLRKLAEHPAWDRAAHRSDEPSATSAMNQALLRLRRVAQPGSLIILLSDFAGLNGQGPAHISQLARHNDLVLVDIHDPLEAELPPPGRYRVSDGQRFVGMETGDNALRQRYRRHYAARRTELQQLCRRHAATLLPLATGDDPLAGLQRGMGGRR